MPTLRTSFGGLLTDLPANRIPSGSADIALNVTVDGGRLQKRSGFAELEDAVSSTTGVIFLDTATFANGDVYIIVKLSNGKLYRRKVYPTDAGSFSQITTSTTHNSGDIGWSFMYADRWHYFDRGGGSRWNPDVNSGTAYKAGLPRPSTGPLPLAAKSGGMEGYYQIYYTYRNSSTREESAPSGTHSEFSTWASTEYGGALISNSNSIVGANTTYEWDRIVYYSSFGSTEYLGAGSGYANPTYRAYEAKEVAKAGGTHSLVRGDAALPTDKPLPFAGGEPPGAKVGCFNERYGIYGQVYDGTSLVPGVMRFSIPGYPTMVPKRQDYSGRIVDPNPWVGETLTACKGPMTGIHYGGGTTALFTPTSAYQIGSMSDARLYARKISDSRGCVTEGAAVGTPSGIHSLGVKSWLLITSQSVQDIAQYRFSTTLADIPAASLDKTRAGYYSYADQVWVAVVKSGGTVAKRILVYDAGSGSVIGNKPIGALVVFEPVGLGTSEGIAAMTELSVPNAEPKMLLGTSTGRILSYPDTTAQDGPVASKSNYACQWRGYFGQESISRQQRLDSVEVHTGSNAANNVSVKARGLRTGSFAGATQAGENIVANNNLQQFKIAFDRQDARMFQLDITSANTVASQWDITDVVYKINVQ